MLRSDSIGYVAGAKIHESTSHEKKIQEKNEPN